MECSVGGSSHICKIDPKIKLAQIYVSTQNMFPVVGLFEEIGGRRERKGEW
jgi:hypothetical protein